MKKIFMIVIHACAFIFNAQAQSGETKKVSDAVDILIKAMVDADNDQLGKMVANELVYGHSGGTVQNKEAFINEVVSSKPLDFLSIAISEQSITVSGKTAVVRNIFTARASRDGEPVDIKIGVMMIWQKQQGNWKLLARQAYKLS